MAAVSLECRNNIKDFASREGLRMCAEEERVMLTDSMWTPEASQLRSKVLGGWRVEAQRHDWPAVFYTIALNDAKILQFRLSRGDSELRRSMTNTGEDSGLFGAAITGADLSARFIVEQLQVATDPLDGSTCLSPLLMAAHWGRTAMCRYLVQQGADPRRVTDAGATAVHRASMGDPDTIHYLVHEAGCRDMVNRTMANGATPLVLAAINYRLDCALELLACGADVDAGRSAVGFSALHQACWAGAGALIVTLLLDAGADPTTLDLSGETAADDACSETGDHLCALRRACRAEILALLASGTPAQQAKTRGSGHAMKERWAEAEAAYTESIEANTAPAVKGRTGKLRRETLADRALVRIHLELWADALDDCEAALELDPENIKALMGRAKCRREMGNEAGAREDAELAIIIDPREKRTIEEFSGLRM